MTPNEIVPLYLVILMVVIGLIALVGGAATDKKMKNKDN